MQAQSRDSRPSAQALPTPQVSSRELEYLFIFLRFPALLDHVVNTAWSRLRSLVSPTMLSHSVSIRRLRLRHSATLFACVVMVSAAARAQTFTGDPIAEPVRREILAIYDSREEARPDQTRIHRLAEMPLNYLGFVVSYWDVNAPLPSAERTASARGVLTWFRRAPPSAFYLWGLERLTSGVRMVVLGDSGLPSGNTSLADANRMFGEIGFGLSGAVVDVTYAARILHRDDLIGFERAARSGAAGVSDRRGAAGRRRLSSRAGAS